MSIPFSIINYYGYSVNFLKRMDFGEKSWLLEVVDNSNEKVVLVELDYPMTMRKHIWFGRIATTGKWHGPALQG